MLPAALATADRSTAVTITGPRGCGTARWKVNLTEQGGFNFTIVATDVSTGASKEAGTYNFTVLPAGDQM
jgi:hypothetical protein